MYDNMIIGSGPAGLSAAIYAKSAGLYFVVVEQNPMSGGQVLNTYEVDNYPGLPGVSGFDLGTKFREHADRLGVTFIEGAVTGIVKKEQSFEVLIEDTAHQSKTVLLAMGADHAKLGVPGEEEHIGMGVSYCATCDGAFYRGKTVAVVGGGDSALEDAIYLSRFCEKVILIHRRKEFRGTLILQEELKALPNVEILYEQIVLSIHGASKVESITLQNIATQAQSTVNVDGVFVAVGIRPNTQAFLNLVDCDEGGYVIAGEDGITKTPGIFVAGDARTKPLRQIVTAVSDGANAIKSVGEYLRMQSK
jgi:thioredoxin reductase (NADPH)